MTIRRGLHVADENGEGADALEARLALAALFTEYGVIEGLEVTGRAAWSYNVAAGKLVSSRSAADGAVLFANDSVAIVGTGGEGTTVTPAPATGSRIDIIYALHRDVDNGDADSLPVFGVASGLASGTPVAPSIPVGAVELARATLAAGATNTAHANVTISSANAPRAAVRGSRRVLYAIKGSGTFSLTSQSSTYDWMGGMTSWTAVGPATAPPEFSYTSADRTGHGNAFIANVAGLFRISASVQFDNNATGLRYMRIVANGVVLKKAGGPAALSGRTIVGCDATTYLEAGDIIGVQVIQNSGGPLELYSGEDSRSVVMEYLGS